MRIYWVLLCIALTWPATQAASRDAPSVRTLTHGEELAWHEPAGGQGRMVQFVIADGVRGFDLNVLADGDVDVFLRRGRPFVWHPLAEADIVGRRAGQLERVQVSGRLAPGRWFAWLVPEVDTQPTRVCAVLRVADQEPVFHLSSDVLSARDLVGEAPRVWVPDVIDAYALGWAGPARLAGRWRDALAGAPTLKRAGGSQWSRLHASFRDEAAARTSDADLVRFRLEHRAAGEGELDEKLDEELDEDSSTPTSIKLGASRKLTLGGDQHTERVLRMEVPAGTHGFVVEASGEDGADIDLYVRRGKGLEANAKEANWLGVSVTRPEQLVVRGDDVLAGDTYWICAHLVGDDEAVDVQVATRRLEAHNKGRSWATDAARLPLGRWTRGRVLTTEAPITWYRVALPAGARHLTAQLWDATTPLDLLVATPTDGSIVWRGVSERSSEGVEIALGSALGEAQEIYLGILAFDLYEGDINYRVCVTANQGPLLPDDWTWPPRPLAGGLPAAATVELALHDGSGGTAAIVSPTGYLLTCRHVLEDDKNELQKRDVLVSVPERWDRAPRQLFVADVVHEHAALDLALLKIRRDVFGRDLPRTLRLPYVRLSKDVALTPGTEVDVLGYPGQGSTRTRTPLILTRGIVSGLEADADGVLRWIKTDAWVAPGNSGGVLTRRGRDELVAVPAATLGDNGVLTLAVPVSRIPAAWRELLPAGAPTGR